MLTIPEFRGGAPLDLAAIRAADAAQRAALVAQAAHSSREEIAARVSACRSCPDAATGSATCSACELRCGHIAAQPGQQLIALAASTCPRGLWPRNDT